MELVEMLLFASITVAWLAVPVQRGLAPLRVLLGVAVTALLGLVGASPGLWAMLFMGATLSGPSLLPFGLSLVGHAVGTAVGLTLARRGLPPRRWGWVLAPVGWSVGVASAMVLPRASIDLARWIGGDPTLSIDGSGLALVLLLLPAASALALWSVGAPETGPASGLQDDGERLTIRGRPGRLVTDLRRLAGIDEVEFDRAGIRVGRRWLAWAEVEAVDCYDGRLEVRAVDGSVRVARGLALDEAAVRAVEATAGRLRPLRTAAVQIHPALEPQDSVQLDLR